MISMCYLWPAEKMLHRGFRSGQKSLTDVENGRILRLTVWKPIPGQWAPGRGPKEVEMARDAWWQKHSPPPGWGCCCAPGGLGALIIAREAVPEEILREVRILIDRLVAMGAPWSEAKEALLQAVARLPEALQGAR